MAFSPKTSPKPSPWTSMAAAALMKNGHRRYQFLHRFWTKICSKHSVPDPPNKIGNHQLHQSNSILRKIKYPDFSSSTIRKSSSSPKFGFVRWYLGMISTRPVSTKSVTSAFIYTAADLSAQTIVEGNAEGNDWVRTLRMAGYGLIIIGPSLHYWFNFVSRVFPNRDLFSTFTKMALGQTVYGPTVTAIFFFGNAASQGESGSEIVGRLKRDLIPTLLGGIMYWPICDFLTFKFIPIHLQPLVSNSFSYLWTVYLTYMANLERVDTC